MRMNTLCSDIGATVPHASAWGRQQSEDPPYDADSSQARSLTVGARFITDKPRQKHVLITSNVIIVFHAERYLAVQ